MAAGRISGSGFLGLVVRTLQSQEKQMVQTGGGLEGTRSEGWDQRRGTRDHPGGQLFRTAPQRDSGTAIQRDSERCSARWFGWPVNLVFWWAD